MAQIIDQECLAYGMLAPGAPDPKVLDIPEGFSLVRVSFKKNDLIKATIARGKLEVVWSMAHVGTDLRCVRPISAELIP